VRVVVGGGIVVRLPHGVVVLVSVLELVVTVNVGVADSCHQSQRTCLGSGLPPESLGTRGGTCRRVGQVATANSASRAISSSLNDIRWIMTEDVRRVSSRIAMRRLTRRHVV